MKGKHFSKNAKLAGYEFYASFWLGELYILINNYAKAKEILTDAVTIEKRAIWGPSAINVALLALSAAKTLNNEKSVDLRSLNDMVGHNKYKRFDGRVRKYLSIILLNIDEKQIIESEKLIEQAIQMDIENGLKCELGIDYLTYADMLKQKGNITKAKESLDQAKQVFHECGADGSVKRIEKELALII